MTLESKLRGLREATAEGSPERSRAEAAFVGEALPFLTSICRWYRGPDLMDEDLLANRLSSFLCSCADLTGGVVVEREVTATRRQPHEYRLEVEIKVGDEPQRPEQIARMHSVRIRGGCYVLARSVEDAVAQIKAFIEGTDR